MISFMTHAMKFDLWQREKRWQNILLDFLKGRKVTGAASWFF